MDLYQSQCLEQFKQGKSITILGPAGSGKSFVLKQMIKKAKEKFRLDHEVLVCAYTNTASKAIGGNTIHRSFGARSGMEISKLGLLQSVNNSPIHRSVLLSLKVLFIDEISMLKANEIEAIDFVLRSLSEIPFDASCPFANIQVVFCGDPFQLEPVKVRNSSTSFQTFFESRSWRLTFGGYGNGVIVSLEGNHRQSEDNHLYNVLQRIRLGKQSSKDIEDLNRTSKGEDVPPDGYTRLVLRNNDMNRINKSAQDQLPGMEYHFSGADIIADTARHRITLGELRSQLNEMVPRHLIFKEGDQIILTRRFQGILPGTKGTISNISHETLQIHFSDNGSQTARDEFKVTRMKYELFDIDGNLLGSRMQFPLLISYALTVRRVQGISLKRIAIDFRDFDNWALNGAVYVALRRCSNFNSLWIRNLKERHVSISSRTISLVKLLLKLQNIYPARIQIGQSLLINDSGTDPMSLTSNSAVLDRFGNKRSASDFSDFFSKRKAFKL